MRKTDSAAPAARRAPVSAAGRDDATVQLVCLALVVSLIALVCRIVSIW
jgi:hypothetical protein